MEWRIRKAYWWRFIARVFLISVWGAIDLCPAIALSAESKTASPPEVFAVLPFEQVGGAWTQAQAATDRLQELLLHSGKFTVIDHTEIQSKLFTRVESYEIRDLQKSECTRTGAAARAAKRLDVQKWICGKVVRVDDLHWVISISLVDVDTAQVLRAASLEYEGRFQEFLSTGVHALIGELALPEHSTVVMPVPPAERERRAQASTPPSAAPDGVPKQGFALFVGPAYREGSLILVGGLKMAYSTGELLLGLNYQWVLAPQWSALINLALGTGGGGLGQSTGVFTSSSDTMYGAQVRHWWPGGGNFGVEAGHYSTIFHSDSSGSGISDLILDGDGFGIVGGYAWPDGGFWDLTASNASLRGRITSSFFPPESVKSQERRIQLSFGHRW
jgi:hypothetical protein